MIGAENMPKRNIVTLTLLLIALVTAAHSQTFEVTCPAGTNPMPFGVTYNQVTNQNRAWICVDPTGHVTMTGPTGGSAGTSLLVCPTCFYSTPQAALNVANATGNVEIYVAPGTYSCPTSWTGNGIKMIGLSPLSAATTFNCGAAGGFTLANLTTIEISGINWDMQSQAGSTNFQIQSTNNSYFDLNINNCVTTAPCLTLGINGSCSGNLCNVANNYFKRVFMAGGSEGLKLLGTTSTGTGAITPSNAAVTGNYFSYVKSLNPSTTFLDIAKGADTNFIDQFWAQAVFTSGSTGVVFNSVTPASDIDADGNIIRFLSFNVPVQSTGTGIQVNNSTANYIGLGFGLSNYPGATQVVYANNPSIAIDYFGQAGPFTAANSMIRSGTIAAGAAPATGAGAGDISASRTATTGAMYFGTDAGVNLFRNGTLFTLTLPAGGLWAIPNSAYVEIAVGSLPSAAANPGRVFAVSDSTAVATEGQTCVGSSTNHALAYSNGSVWKCF